MNGSIDGSSGETVTQGDCYSNSTVLISGGSGSIGSEIARQLLKMDIRQVRLFSNDENGLFEARAVLGRSPRITYALGDVASRERTRREMTGCDVVLHAAALKHVDFCEENPYAAISTNVLGTQNAIDLAMEIGVSRFVYISTDKAVNPISAMGATKLLGEKLVIDASKKSKGTMFCCVRFGNVLGSRGSVVKIFERQVRNGEAVTVTDPAMTRFIMLPAEAAQLVLEAGGATNSGEIFVLKMRAVKVGDLAHACAEFFAKLYHMDPRRVSFQEIGVSPGEKMHEELMTTSEALRAVDKDRFFVIPPESHASPSRRSGIPTSQSYSSNSVPLISKDDVIKFLSLLYLPQ